MRRSRARCWQCPAVSLLSVSVTARMPLRLVRARSATRSVTKQSQPSDRTSHSYRPFNRCLHAGHLEQRTAAIVGDIAEDEGAGLAAPDLDDDMLQVGHGCEHTLRSAKARQIHATGDNAKSALDDLDANSDGNRVIAVAGLQRHCERIAPSVGARHDRNASYIAELEVMRVSWRACRGKVSQRARRRNKFAPQARSTIRRRRLEDSVIKKLHPLDRRLALATVLQ